MSNLKQAELNFINARTGTLLTLTEVNQIKTIIEGRNEALRHVQSVYSNMLSVETVFNTFQPGGALHNATRSAAWGWFDTFGVLFDLAQPEFARPA